MSREMKEILEPKVSDANYLWRCVRNSRGTFD